MHKTFDLHVVETRPLISPATLHSEFPITETAAALVTQTRDRIRNILQNEDHRLLVIVGPCSVHDINAAYEYGKKLIALRKELEEDLEIVMRVYFEKPRTTVGWKGLINDPHLDDSYDINTGLRLARQLLIGLADLGLPAATEMLDPITAQYLADMIAWTAIGARTTESQTHREMASGLSMPIGFKIILMVRSAPPPTPCSAPANPTVSWALTPTDSPALSPPQATPTATWFYEAASKVLIMVPTMFKSSQRAN